MPSYYSIRTRYARSLRGTAARESQNTQEGEKSTDFFLKLKACPALLPCTRYLVHGAYDYVLYTSTMHIVARVGAHSQLSTLKYTIRIMWIRQTFVISDIKCTIGSVVECVIAIHATRVRFSDIACFFFLRTSFYGSCYFLNHFVGNRRA